MSKSEAYIIDGIRTPIGKLKGTLSSIRADDLAAIPIKELLKRNPELDPASVEDVILGCANQAGEDNRNVARMAAFGARRGCCRSFHSRHFAYCFCYSSCCPEIQD